MEELDAALLEGVVTLGTAVVCGAFYLRSRRPDFLWWTVAWLLYTLRIGAISAFLVTRTPLWLFVHQVLTGTTALVVLWAALTYSRTTRWRPAFALALLFPLGWSYIAIYQLDSFMLAAVPAVLFLSGATFSTAWVFYRQWRLTRSRGAQMLAIVLFTWALHHLDYPILRARGAWNPWGYYLDILFALAMTIGIVLLVLEELDRRTRDLERLSAQMVNQHEDERRRLSLELHDQTAQVWAAVKLQLGLAREAAPPALVDRLDRALSLVDARIASIRGVTSNLRPPLLDELGVMPALRALARAFADQTGLRITVDAPDELPPMSSEAGLALYRALQEALSNVTRHAEATSASVRIGLDGGRLTMIVRDNGRGPVDPPSPRSVGLAGMRERITALRGTVSFAHAPTPGSQLTVTLPLHVD
jgi:signal transduction histidine kinase